MSAGDGSSMVSAGPAAALAGYSSPTDRAGSLAAMQRLLNDSPDQGALLAQAAEVGCRACGFERGVVLAVSNGRLRSSGMDPVSDPASEALRRRSLPLSIPLAPESREAGVLRQAEETGPIAGSGPCLLVEPLELREYALAPLAPESRAVALLVLDRSAPPVGAKDLGAVELFAHLVAVAIEHVVLRLRMVELSNQFRHATASANALIKDALETPIALDSTPGQDLTEEDPELAPLGGLSELLSDRESEIATLMIRGRSNREIGEVLHLSPDTIKAHVARLVRKLGASNRVEAVAKYVAMSKESDIGISKESGGSDAGSA